MCVYCLPGEVFVAYNYSQRVMCVYGVICPRAFLYMYTIYCVLLILDIYHYVIYIYNLFITFLLYFI